MLDQQVEELNLELGAAVQHRDVVRDMYRDSPNSANAEWLAEARREVAKLNARARRLHARIAREWNTPAN